MTIRYPLPLVLLCSLLVPMHARALDHDANVLGALVTMVEGNVRTTAKTDPKGRAVRKGERLTKDQELRIAERSRIELRFPDDTVMRFSENTTVRLNDIFYSRQSDAKRISVGLLVGKVWAKVRKLTNVDSRVEVRTTNAVAGVRGTVYRVNAEEDKSALVKVYDGSVDVGGIPQTERKAASSDKPVEVSGPHEVPPPYHEVSMEEWHVIVKSFQQVAISPDGKPSQPSEFTPQEDADDWVRWNQERDRLMTF